MSILRTYTDLGSIQDIQVSRNYGDNSTYLMIKEWNGNLTKIELNEFWLRNLRRKLNWSISLFPKKVKK